MPGTQLGCVSIGTVDELYVSHKSLTNVNASHTSGVVCTIGTVSEQYQYALTYVNASHTTGFVCTVGTVNA